MNRFINALCLLYVTPILFFAVGCTMFRNNNDPERIESLLQKGRPELLQYYESHRSEFRGAELLSIGRCYASEKMYDKAKQVFGEYAEQNPDDRRGWYFRAGMCFLLKEFDQAIEDSKRARRLGSSDAVRLLAASHLANAEFAKVKELVPSLLEYAKSRNTSKSDGYEAIGVGLMAAVQLEPPDRSLFLECVANLPSEKSAWPEDIARVVEAGAKLFQP